MELTGMVAWLPAVHPSSTSLKECRCNPTSCAKWARQFAYEVPPRELGIRETQPLAAVLDRSSPRGTDTCGLSLRSESM